MSTSAPLTIFAVLMLVSFDEYVREFYRRVKEMINDPNINTEGIGWLKHFLA